MNRARESERGCYFHKQTLQCKDFSREWDSVWWLRINTTLTKTLTEREQWKKKMINTKNKKKQLIKQVVHLAFQNEIMTKSFPNLINLLRVQNSHPLDLHCLVIPNFYQNTAHVRVSLVHNVQYLHSGQKYTFLNMCCL